MYVFFEFYNFKIYDIRISVKKNTDENDLRL